MVHNSTGMDKKNISPLPAAELITLWIHDVHTKWLLDPSGTLEVYHITRMLLRRGLSNFRQYGNSRFLEKQNILGQNRGLAGN